MARKKQHIGSRFGRLVVIGESSNIGSRTSWLCKCDCGVVNPVMTSCFVSGRVVSCGCFRSEQLTRTNTIHGLYKSPEHESWAMMIQRCTNPNRPDYNYYGGRGITVYGQWRHFLFFLEDMGTRPIGTTLDRIDNNGNYEPGNCRWATPIEQSSNKRGYGTCGS